MNILIVSAVFYPEQVVSARLSEALARELSKTEHVTVICPQPTRPLGADYSRFVDSETAYQRVVLTSYTHPRSSFLGRMRESYSFGRATVRYIKKHKREIDCIYMNTFPLAAQYLTLHAAKKYRIPILTHIHDIYPESMLSRLGLLGRITGPILKLLDRHYIGLSDRVISISENMEMYLKQTRGLTGDQTMVIRNWQDESLFIQDIPAEDSGKFTFMFVGSISPAAGVDFILKVFLESGLQNCRFYIAGSGSMRQTCEKIAAARPDMEVIFESVSPEDVPAVQSKADILVLPLKKGIGKTASPSKLPAYMYSAKPVLASLDAGSDAEYIIQTADCGWVVGAEDADALIGMMRQVSALPKDKLQQFGENGRTYALRHFSREKNLKMLCEAVMEFKK